MCWEYHTIKSIVFCSRTALTLELFLNRAVQLTGLRSGVLSVDDTVLDKPYRDIEKTELVGFFWSGKHHRAVKGINLIVLIYTRWDGVSAPVNFRLYRHSDNKTKNDYFLEMM